MFRQRLVECYLLRLAALGTVTGFALTNPRLLDFVWRCWTVAGGPAASTEDRTLDADAVGYEIFRRLLSKYLDPLEGENATRAAVLLATKADEIEAMRRQCLRLAEKLPGVPLNRLQAEVAAYVELHVADELAAVLEMTERGLRTTSPASSLTASSGRPCWRRSLGPQTVTPGSLSLAESAWRRH